MARHVKLNKPVLAKLIEEYTSESGVRNLSRQIAGVMRNIAKMVAMDASYNPTVKPENLKEMLGPSRFSNDLYKEAQPKGVAIGLAWTSVGGVILFIETSLHKGKGGLTMTGNLGDVMKESASTALSYIKANAEALGVDPKAFEEHDIHIHVPEGAIPKDGPSAGITMLTSLTSAFTGKAVKPFVAMTGEITLRGKVLPVGGIKEKILAAKRSGMKEIVLCLANRKDVEDINQDYISGLKFHYVDRMNEVLELVLGMPVINKRRVKKEQKAAIASQNGG